MEVATQRAAMLIAKPGVTAVWNTPDKQVTAWRHVTEEAPERLRAQPVLYGIG